MGFIVKKFLGHVAPRAISAPDSERSLIGQTRERTGVISEGAELLDFLNDRKPAGLIILPENAHGGFRLWRL